MAKVLDPTLTYVSFPIVKREETDEGIVVYGKATDGRVDADDQIVDSDWSGRALQKWLTSAGNVRVQHNPQLYPAGKGLSVEIDRDGDGGHWVKALVVEPVAQKLVRAGVLRAYSIGVAKPVIRRDMTAKARGGIVADGEIAELSLVDRPSNSGCGITLAKAEGEVREWTYGDLEALLAKAETKKAKKKAKPAGQVLYDSEDEGDVDGVDDGQDADDETNDPSDDDTKNTAEDQESGEGDGEDSDLSKSYKADRAAWLAREPLPNIGDAANNGGGTAFLAKMAARDAWQRWDDEGTAAGLDGTATGYQAWLTKAKDRGVGGGVDRDTIPAEDHIDPDGRRYPIVTPADVPDAAALAGSGKPRIPKRAFRRRLTAIARRKGPDFVAALPKSWATKNITTTTPLATGLVPYNLAGADSTMEPELTKDGGTSCPYCGASLPTGVKNKRCPACAAKMTTKNATTKAKAKPAKPIQKGKASKRRLLPPDVAMATDHREPDGPDVEALEADAGLPTDNDAAVDKNVAPYTVKRMHDAVCPAYRWKRVAKTYLSLRSVGDAVNADWFDGQVAQKARRGDLAGVALATAAAHAADTIVKGLFNPMDLATARNDATNAFAAMYPDVKLSPSAPPTPGSFQRPFLSAGRAALSAATSSMPPAIPPTAHTVAPDDFRRPLITEGHQASPPGSAANNLNVPTVASGSGQVMYATAGKDAATNAMAAMHDHIATTFPGLCPLAPTAAMAGITPSMGAGNGLQPTMMPADKLSISPYATPDDVVTAVRRAVGKARKADKARVRRAVTTLNKARRRTTLNKARITALEAEINKLGAQPDPAQAPLRGIIRKAATLDSAPATVPAERISLLEKAQHSVDADRQEYAAYLQRMASSANPNPQQREQAEAVLAALLTAP